MLLVLFKDFALLHPDLYKLPLDMFIVVWPYTYQLLNGTILVLSMRSIVYVSLQIPEVSLGEVQSAAPNWLPTFQCYL